MLDRDLAELYGVETKRLKEQVRRNIGVHPEFLTGEVFTVKAHRFYYHLATNTLRERDFWIL